MIILCLLLWFVCCDCDLTLACLVGCLYAALFLLLYLCRLLWVRCCYGLLVCYSFVFSYRVC